MSAARRKKHRLWLWLLLLLALPALSLFMWFWASADRTDGKSKPASPAVGRVEQQDRVLATGVVRPQVGAEVNVGTRISGRVESVRAAIGDRVKKGDILAKLERDELEAAVKMAEAASSAAWTRLALLQKGSRPEEIKAAQASVDGALAVSKDAERELERRKRLYAEDLISREQLDHAQRDFDVAQSKLRASEEAAALKRKLYRPEEIALARYAALEAGAALETARIRLDYAIIRSPIDGVVASVSMQNGESVSVGLQAPTLVTIIDLDRLQVEAYVDEVDIGRVKLGGPASFTVDTYPDSVFKGTVHAIYPKAILEDNVVNYLTIISFSAPAETLRPGMTANVSIETDPTRRNGSKSEAVAGQDTH